MNDHSAYHGDSARPSGGGAVVLVHFGSPIPTGRCVRSLVRHEGPGVRVIVADNGPGEPLHPASLLDDPSEELEILHLDNPGFGAGCNAAAARAFETGAEWVWFLNSDTTLAGPTLSRLLALAREHPEVGLWGTFQREGARLIGADRLPRWFPPPAYATPTVEGLPPDCRQLGARETLSGASILVSRRTWERMGPWPEWCFLYWEDAAWCLRAHGEGIPLVMTELEIAHIRNTTTGRHSPLTTYYGVRNSLLLHKDLWPRAWWLRLRQAGHLVQKRCFRGQWGMVWPTVQGIVDAWRGRRFRGA